MQIFPLLPDPITIITTPQFNPMLTLGIAPTNTKCKDCRFLKKHHHVKCQLRPSKNQPPTHYPNWQACARFQSLDPKCPGCQAKRLDECTC